MSGIRLKDLRFGEMVRYGVFVDGETVPYPAFVLRVWNDDSNNFALELAVAGLRGEEHLQYVPFSDVLVPGSWTPLE